MHGYVYDPENGNSDAGIEPGLSLRICLMIGNV